MNVSQASKIWLDYHRAHSKKNTVRAYEFTIAKFNQNFADLNFNEVSTDDVLDFIRNSLSEKTPEKTVSFFSPDRIFQFYKK
jgi:hypothetical protein